MSSTVTRTPDSDTQRQAVETLAAIIGEGLTPLNWSLFVHNPNHLDGQVSTHSDDERKIATVAEYAALLGREVTRARGHDGTYTSILVTGVYQGVQVKVWGHIEKAAAVTE